jgi:hypothetical protein
MDAPEEMPDEPQPSAPAWQAALGIAVLLGLAYGGYRFVKAVDPGTVAMPEDPGFVELVIADRTVLTVIRVALIVGLAYAIWSVVALVRQGRFLIQVPGVAVSDAAELAQGVATSSLVDENELELALEEANDNVELLLEYIELLRARLSVYEDPDDWARFDEDDEEPEPTPEPNR